LIRFDRFLAQKQQSLSLSQKLKLIRQLLEAMASAHGKRLFHRGLARQNILVRDPDGDAPRLQITDWQVASGAEGSLGGLVVTVGTQCIEDHLSDPAKVYRAPEIGAEDGAAQADVFSLVAIAYHVFAGRPPADPALELPTTLLANDRIRLSASVNGLGTWLDELINASTKPSVGARLRRRSSVSASLSKLFGVPMPSFCKDLWTQCQAFTRNTLAVLWDFKGLRGPQTDFR